MRLTIRGTAPPSPATDFPVVRETVLAATLAGLVAALIFTVIQSVWLTPLILKGETYEEAAERTQQQHEATTAEHHHDEDAWKPENGVQRTLFTFAANLLMGVGYGFVLVALYLLWREPRTTLEGALYGLGGYLVVFGAPALGLHPELPGTASAELALRQEWWALIAVATAAGLMLFVSQSRWWLRLLAVAIIVAPHFIPAPQPAVESSLAPEDLQTRFRWASTFCNAIFWLSLGVASGVMFRKWVAGRRGGLPA
jgi:cobalt transporter subunit CbtA